MSINKITRKNYPTHFDSFISDFYETSYQEHRRGSNFYTRSIVWLDEQFEPDFPELWGFWETNTYIWDDDDGYNKFEIDELTRVEKKTKIIEETYWAPIQEEITNPV
jgi:hypothetical protein